MVDVQDTKNTSGVEWLISLFSGCWGGVPIIKMEIYDGICQEVQSREAMRINRLCKNFLLILILTQVDVLQGGGTKDGKITSNVKHSPNGFQEASKSPSKLGETAKNINFNQCKCHIISKFYCSHNHNNL